MEAAIVREKQHKKWNRLWKIRLIEGANPEWLDHCGAILDLPADNEAETLKQSSRCPRFPPPRE
jgi:hypothetical protein